MFQPSSCFSNYFPLCVCIMNSALASTTDAETDGKKAPTDAPPVNIGWDSHKAVVRNKYLNIETELD